MAYRLHARSVTESAAAAAVCGLWRHRYSYEAH